MASVQGGTGSQLLLLEISFCASVHCLAAHSSVLSGKTLHQGNLWSLTATAESRRQQGIQESHCQALGSDAVQMLWECQTLLKIDLASI